MGCSTRPRVRQVGSSELKRNYRDGGVKGTIYRSRAMGEEGGESKMGLIYYRATRAKWLLVTRSFGRDGLSLNRSDRKLASLTRTNDFDVPRLLHRRN